MKPEEEQLPLQPITLGELVKNSHKAPDDFFPEGREQLPEQEREPF